MKRKSFGLAAVLLAAATAVHAQGDPIQTVAAFHAALAGGSKEAVLAFLAPNVVIFEPGVAEVSRDEYAAHHLGSDMEFAKATTEKVIDRRSGRTGDAAWVLTRWEATGTFRGKKVHSRGAETIILERAVQSWRIVHIHWSSAKKN